MNAPVLIYISTTTLAVVMCLWAIAAAIVGSESRVHRLVTGGCACGLILATAAAGLATQLGSPRLVWTCLLLPPLILGTSWSTVITIRGAPIGVKVAAAPILVYNLFLMGVYTTWAVHECAGIEIGKWGCALVAAFTQLQTVVGHPNAGENPVWLQLPIVLPVWNALRNLETTGLIASCVQSAFMMLMFVLVMPLSFKRAESFYSALPGQPNHSSDLGIMVPWGDQPLSESQRKRLRVRLQLVNARDIVFRIDHTSFEDPRMKTQLIDEVKWAKSAGLNTTAITSRPARYATIPAASLADLCEEMGRVQSSAARHLTPTHLVLFSGPFGRLASYVAKSPTPEDWLEAISQSASDIRPNSPRTRLIVTIDNFDTSGGALFQLLSAKDSPVDGIGAAIIPRGRLFDEVDADFRQLESWCRSSPGHRPVSITECRCPPQLLGGDQGQWNLFSRALELADRTDIIATVSLNSLYDLQTNIAMITWAGRTRRAYRELESSAGSRSGGARPGK